MKIKQLPITALLVSTLLLTGCASGKKFVDLKLQYVTTGNTPVNAVDRNAQAQIAEAATSVSHSMNTLSALQLATHPGVKMPTPQKPSGGLARRANLNWVGPVEPLLSRIASASGFRVKILGKKPAVPLIVYISTPKPNTQSAILRNTTYQVAGKATITVYTAQRLIELHYRKLT